MEHNSGYVWLPVSIDRSGEDDEVTDRFQEQYSPGVISYVQNGHRLFSQMTAEFPNIYLVRGDWIEDRNPIWENLCIPHRHSYWLKRLILEYIAVKQREKDWIHPDSVYSVFCNSGDGNRAYDSEIVRLCLGSLAQVEKSHVIDFRFTGGSTRQEVSRIALTERGWRLLGFTDKGRSQAANRFVDTFTYLQLVVDDYVMPVLDCVNDVFKYTADCDYRYLAAPQREYGQKLASIIRLKIRQVCVFLDILRIALEQEREMFSGSFDRLERELTLPNVDDIEDHVEETFRPLQEHLERTYKVPFGLSSHRLDRETYLSVLKEQIEATYRLGQDEVSRQK
jgi:hypothetical protein